MNNKTIYNRFLGEYIQVTLINSYLYGQLKEATFDCLVLNPSLISNNTDTKTGCKIEDVDEIVPLNAVLAVNKSSRERLEEICKDSKVANELKQKEIRDKLKDKKNEE